jgi:hypothetical protein
VVHGDRQRDDVHHRHAVPARNQGRRHFALSSIAMRHKGRPGAGLCIYAFD